MVLPCLCPAREIYVGVDPDAPTINHGIKLAHPGDTIHLEAGKVYREYAGFYGKKGAPGKPITLDGHGAILEGADPLDPAKWREISPGFFAAEELIPRLDEAIIARWFFLFDGKMQWMGRTSKGRSEPLKKPGDLLPGEWTFVRDPAREPKPSSKLAGTFFLKLSPGSTLTDAKIEIPVRSAGVQFAQDNSHLVIKNLTATHPYNDGFNIHGDCREVVFENIRAIECGDDGISAHESAQYSVDGFASIRNSTGICDTGTAQTRYRNVLIRDCIGFDLYFLDEGRYTLTNALILSKAQNPMAVTGRDGGECRLAMENVHFRRLAEPRWGKIMARATVTGQRCTFEGLEWKVEGLLAWKNSLLNGSPSEPGATGADLEALSRLAPPSYQNTP